MVGESGGDRGDSGGGGGERARCVRCDLEYNRDDRCPRVLVCGHTCCTTCLDDLITEGQKRCPTCSRQFFSLSVVLIPKNLEVLDGAKKSSKSTGSSEPPVSSYRSPFTSSSSSSFEVTKSSEKSSQSLKSSYSSPLRSSLSSNLEVPKSPEKSSSYSSPLRSSLSHDSSLEVTDGSEKSSMSLQTSESWKSSHSFKSSYTSTLRSYSSFDSSLERPTASTEKSFVSSPLKSSSFFGSSLVVREDREDSVRSDDVSESSSSALSPPPVPSSAPPSLQEYNSGLLTSEVRSQGGTGASEVDGGGGSGSLHDLNSDGDRSGGGDGGDGSGTRPSTLSRNPSADQASGGSYAPPTYSFPTIRTKLNINGIRKPENDSSRSSSSGKAELRLTKSMPPSSFPSSTSKKEDESLSSVPPSSGYTSPFLKSSTSSSSSSSLRTNTFRSTYSENQKLSSKDTAATDSTKETKSKTLSSSSPSPFRTSTFRTLSSDAQKLSSRDTVATGSEKETKNKTFSSSPSPFRTSTFRTMSSEANKLSSRNTVTTDSEKEQKNKTATSDYSSLSSSSLSSTNESSPSRSMPSLHKLEAKLSVPPAAEQKDEVDLGVSRWKIQTPSSLSRKKNVKDAPSLRTEEQNSASTSSKASGTPSHVLRMIRSVTTKTRYADDTTKVANIANEASTTLFSHREATTTTTPTTSSSPFSSSSSSSSSLLTTSKDSHTLQESGQFGQDGATTQQMSQNSAASEVPPAGSATPEGVSDRPSDSVSRLPSPGSDSGERDASEGRSSVPVLGGEADAAARHVPAAAPPTGSMGEESKGSRKLALSASLSARLGARTRFLAAAIDEASEEEEHAGGSESSAGERQGRAGHGDKLYTPDRQGVLQQQQQPAPSRVSLGARISARASYLSGGWGGTRGGASRGEVQAEDSTKIDLQRRAGRAGTKDEAAEEGRDGTLGKAHGAAGAHLTTAEDDAAGDKEAKLELAGPTQSRRPSGLWDDGYPVGDGTPQEASTSGRGDPPGVRGSVVPTHESSQHTQWRRHRPIDSRAKEELSDAGCGPQAASDYSLDSTSTELPHASEGGTSTPKAQPDAGSTTAAAATSALRQNEAAAAPHRHHHQWTKHNNTPSVFRSEAGSVIGTSLTAEGEAGTRGGHERDKAGTPPKLPSSGPYPWRKKWRSVTEHTSSAATRHTPPGANNTALSGTSKQPEQPPPPRSPPASDEVPGRPSGSKGNITASYRASLGALAIGRVPSVQEPDGGGGGDGDKAARRGRAPNTSKTGSWQAAEDTSEDINTRLRRARERLRATTTTPAEEEPPPSPARTNLTYLLTRVQSSEAMARATRKTVLSDDDDDEVFEDSEDEMDGDKHPKPPDTSPSDSLDGGLEANTLENFHPPTGSIQDTGRLCETTTDEVDSVTRRQNHHNDRKEQQDLEERAQEELHDIAVSQNSGATRRSEVNSINPLQNGYATEQWEVNDDKQKSGLENTQQTDQQDQDEAQDAHEDATDAPYEAPPGYFGVGEAEEGEYEPGVGLCSSHGQMLDRYCQDCEEWVCRDCLRVLHRPRPEGSCTVISAAEGVNQIKISHSSFLTSRTNTLEYFRTELRRIIEECNSSINLHKDNIRHLESKIEEERRLVRGIKSMKNLSKEKMRHVDYWEDVLHDNLSRIDESSTSHDVLRAVQESSGDILRKAMEAVSLEASAGVLLSPPN